ncbi:PASTA domain-containing protein [Formosa algae]|uniref:Beta-lactam-binding protein with PASTA domain n=3 Tax=Formosa algae TaxID=225843 RepID=A0A9X0YL93_9FLAO|nr:PASTA domain-containing protein [Formosa algae]MBP1838943.1 beta-lactam-binding protein with PASTA domain [Formosa algae]MDQ0333720.1 beta-lactam-binding protein with PASTA domain [Formosa algae]OEI78904.1 serine/threonine protein kinase [Formosa algae]
MGLIKFLTSKTFFLNLLLAVVAIFVLSYLTLRWLDSTTNHGKFETVPDLTGVSIDVARAELEKNKLVMQIQDSANYNPDYPRFSVIEQDPKAGFKVKEDRKIYITLNPSGYRKVLVPALTDRTFRQAKPTLEALGFQVGTIRYEDNIAKDMVLEVSHDGEKIKTGDMLPKTSKIDLVLGNGNRPE